MHYCTLLPHNMRALCSLASVSVDFDFLLSTNRQSKYGLIGHSLLPIGVNVSCVSLHVSPVMSYSFLRVYSAFPWITLVCSSGQAILWL